MPEIDADPSQLNQVFVNLIVNAMQAMPDGGRLTISTRKRSSTVLLIVEDTGVGMDKETSKRYLPPSLLQKMLVSEQGWVCQWHTGLLQLMGAL
jgi:C4-dicarboxylate-specific signal transduction histidine kinase